MSSRHFRTKSVSQVSPTTRYLGAKKRSKTNALRYRITRFFLFAVEFLSHPYTKRNPYEPDNVATGNKKSQKQIRLGIAALRFLFQMRSGHFRANNVPRISLTLTRFATKKSAGPNVLGIAALRFFFRARNVSHAGLTTRHL